MRPVGRRSSGCTRCESCFDTQHDFSEGMPARLRPPAPPSGAGAEHGGVGHQLEPRPPVEAAAQAAS
eukprot:12896729-Prorocentrum_lima.AAC.1